MEIKRITSFFVLFAFVLGLFVSCDTTSTDANGDQGNVSLQIKTVTNSSPKVFSASTATDHDSLIIEGSNGTLRIDDIRFIVEEFELDPEEAEDDSAEQEEFEAEPFFVDLPLNDETLSLANSQISAGLYEELEFEVENLDFDDGDEDEEHQALADTIRSHFSDWPDEASMVIVGTFTPTDGEARPFKVFAEAEIEIELEFEPPLEVTADNMEQVVLIRINPVRWFEQSDGTVLDLSEYDWDEQQELLEFSAEFENGLEEIEIEDDDD